MQTTTPQTRPGESLGLGLPLEPLRRDYVKPSQHRQFVIDLECDGVPFRHRTYAVTSVDATQRARYAFTAQPCVSEERIRVIACVEVSAS